MLAYAIKFIEAICPCMIAPNNSIVDRMRKQRHICCKEKKREIKKNPAKKIPLEWVLKQ